MMSSFPLRAAIGAVVIAALLAGTGCGLFRTKSAYERAVEGRALEVPPDLDTPAVDPAMAIPPVASSAPLAAPALPEAAESGGFLVEDTVESTWRRLGLALERVEGAQILDRAQLLSAYSVRYRGEEFLVRVASGGASGSRISAVDSSGRELSTGAAGRLLATLRLRLG